MATTGALLALLGTLTFTNTKVRKKIETSPGLALWDSNEYYGFRFGEKKTPGLCGLPLVHLKTSTGIPGKKSLRHLMIPGA